MLHCLDGPPCVCPSSWRRTSWLLLWRRFCYLLERSQGAPSNTPPQDTPTAKNYPTQNVSSTEVEKRCSKYILNWARWSMLIIDCVLLCWGIVWEPQPYRIPSEVSPILWKKRNGLRDVGNMPLVVLPVNGRSQDSDPQLQSLLPSRTLAHPPSPPLVVFWSFPLHYLWIILFLFLTTVIFLPPAWWHKCLVILSLQCSGSSLSTCLVT